MSVTIDKAKLPSRHVTEGMIGALHRIYYYAMGLDSDSIHGPIIGVGAAWTGASSIGDIALTAARYVEEGAWSEGAAARIFGTIGDESGGVPAFPGLAQRCLLGRELVADSVELTMRGHSYDALVGIGSCSSALAGMALCACRLDVPAIVLPLVDGSAEDDRAAAAVLEAVGLAPTGAIAELSSLSASYERWRAAGRTIVEMLAMERTPREIVTEASLHAGAAALAAAGGSAAICVDLAAIANECGIVVEVPELIATMTAASAGDSSGRAIRWVEGSLAPGGAIACAADSTGTKVSGAARIFESEEAASNALRHDQTWEGGVMVVRGLGPRGAGLQNLTALAAHAEASAAPPALIVTDGRLPTMKRVAGVCAVGPEAALPGPLAAISEGDRVELDLGDGCLDVTLSLPANSPTLRHDLPPMLAKLVNTVGPARSGATTHPGAKGERRRYASI
jgi:dihydroxy-acid dehydratase